MLGLVQAKTRLGRNSTVQEKWFEATTTNFGGGQGSCGGCSLSMMGNVAGWAVVATSESMQIPYMCKACPDCQCATGWAQLDAGGPPGGCGNCFEVQTTGTNPYGKTDLPLVTFNAVVADSCPYNANQEWCPEKVGDSNRHGYEFHLDVFSSDHSKLGIGDNPIVKFRPLECPESVNQILRQNCCDVWYQGQGCPDICTNDECPPGSDPMPPRPSPSPTPVPPSPSPTPVPPPSPVPTPTPPTPSPSDCPGGSLDACMDLCPADIFAICVKDCEKRCLGDFI